MHGGIELYPAQETAWAVFATSSKPQDIGVPHALNRELRRFLLPQQKKKKSSDEWNAAIGADGKSSRQFDAGLEGEWVADLALHGKLVPLRMWIDASNFMKMSFGNSRPMRVRCFNHDRLVTVSGGDVVRPRRDTTCTTNLILHLLETPQGPRFQGRMMVDGDYCHLEFRVEFRKAKK